VRGKERAVLAVLGGRGEGRMGGEGRDALCSLVSFVLLHSDVEVDAGD